MYKVTDPAFAFRKFTIDGKCVYVSTMGHVNVTALFDIIGTGLNVPVVFADVSEEFKFNMDETSPAMSSCTSLGGTYVHIHILIDIMRQYAVSDVKILLWLILEPWYASVRNMSNWKRHTDDLHTMETIVFQEMVMVLGTVFPSNNQQYHCGRLLEYIVSYCHRRPYTIEFCCACGDNDWSVIQQTIHGLLHFMSGSQHHHLMYTLILATHVRKYLRDNYPLRGRGLGSLLLQFPYLEKLYSHFDILDLMPLCLCA